MSKRGAGDQLTRENYSNNSDEEEQKHNNIIASSEVMNKRKIAMPKRKMAFSNKTISTASKDESSFASAFNFTKKAKPSVTANDDETPAKLKALNEQFKSKIITVLASDACSDLSSLFSKYSQYINEINGTTNPKLDGSKTTFSAPLTNGFKSAELVKPVETQLPSSGFNFSLNKTSAETSETTIPPVKKQEVEPKSSSESESEEEIKVEGPKFTINTAPIKSDSVFSFGPKKVVPKDDSDSESDIEIKGPEFTFSGSVKSDVFKLKPNEKPVEPVEPVEKSNNIFNIGQEKKPEDDKMVPSFSFGIKKTEENNDNKPNEKPAFTFGQSSTTPVTKPSFGGSFAKPMETSSNDKSETKTPTSAFSFNKPAQTKEAEATPDKPTSAFNFLSKQVPTSAVNKEEKKPAFSFAPASNPTTTTAPSFSFGTKTTETTKDNSVFGLATSSQADNKKENETPVSASGQLATTEEKKPAFTFAQTNSVSKPSFNFGQTKDVESKENNKPSFTFGKPVTSDVTEKVDTKPSFSFGQPTSSTSSTEDKSVPKPSFSFGQPTSTSSITADKTDSKPSFSFGINNTSAPAPSFSFGKPADNSTTASTNPSGGFKFSLPFEQKTTPATTENAKDEDDKSESQPKQENTTTATDNEPKDDIADTETSTPVDLQNGEEDEIKLFAQRAKLMVFNPETKKYDSQGVGEMKLLQKKEDKTKIRLLCRSDGMGNILLNTAVVKSFNYTPLVAEKEEMVKTPTVGADGKLTTYIVRFKQKADGRSFIKSIEDAKKDM